MQRIWYRTKVQNAGLRSARCMVQGMVMGAGFGSASAPTSAEPHQAKKACTRPLRPNKVIGPTRVSPRGRAAAKGEGSGPISRVRQQGTAGLRPGAVGAGGQGPGAGGCGQGRHEPGARGQGSGVGRAGVWGMGAERAGAQRGRQGNGNGGGSELGGRRTTA